MTWFTFKCGLKAACTNNVWEISQAGVVLLASRADGRGDSKTEAPSWTSYPNTSAACVCAGWPHGVRLEWVVKRTQPAHPPTHQPTHRHVPSSLLTSRSSPWRPGETSPGDTSPPRPCESERAEEDETTQDESLHAKGHPAFMLRVWV